MTDKELMTLNIIPILKHYNGSFVFKECVVYPLLVNNKTENVILLELFLTKNKNGKEIIYVKSRIADEKYIDIEEFNNFTLEECREIYRALTHHHTLLEIPQVRKYLNMMDCDFEDIQFIGTYLAVSINNKFEQTHQQLIKLMGYLGYKEIEEQIINKDDNGNTYSSVHYFIR